VNKKKNFEEEISPHIEDLIKLAYTYVKNKQLAEDMVQDVLFKAYEKQDQFRYDASYKTYLYKMTINRCHDYLRSWSYRNHLLTDTFTHFFTSSKSNEELMIEKEKNTTLGKEVLKLKPIYREVIILQYYKHFTTKEIAYLLDVSENTIKTRLLRAKEQLKKQLEQGGLADEFKRA